MPGRTDISSYRSSASDLVLHPCSSEVRRRPGPVADLRSTWVTFEKVLIASPAAVTAMLGRMQTALPLLAFGYLSYTLSNFDKDVEAYWHPCSSELIFDKWRIPLRCRPETTLAASRRGI
jgi:hypothetical protein